MTDGGRRTTVTMTAIIIPYQTILVFLDVLSKSQICVLKECQYRNNNKYKGEKRTSILPFNNVTFQLTPCIRKDGVTM